MNRKFYGATHLLNQITKKLHIDQDLQQCFPHTHKQILSLAYYLTLEDNSPLYRFEKWNTLHKHPYNTNITSQHSSQIFASITEDSKNQFLKLFADHHAQKECWLYDTTTISSYSKTLKQVQYGKNKENDLLPQINIALAYGEKTNLPFYYRKLAGNIVDVTTLNQLVADFKALGFSKVKLVLDRGFVSKANMSLLLADNIEFLMVLKMSFKFVRTALDDVYDELVSFEHYDVKRGLYSMTVPLTAGVVCGDALTGSVEGDRQLFLHLFYDVDRAAEDRKSLDRRLFVMRDELLSGRLDLAHAGGYRKYFFVEKLVGGGVRVVVNDEAVLVARRCFGFFALLSSECRDAVVALELYRNRDLVEKAFGNVKDKLSFCRMLVSSEQSLDGKLFVCYVGLIFLSYIKKCMVDAGLFEYYTLQGVLDCLDVIECFESGESLKVGEMTEKQVQLYKALDVEPPTSL